MSNTKTIFEMGIREYARTPVLLALLVFLPTYFILVFQQVMPNTPSSVDIPIQGMMELEMATVTIILMTPMAVAFISGAAGLFLMQAAREVDGRLVIVGATISEILLARVSVLTVAAVVGSFVSVGILSILYTLENIGWYLIATLLTGLMYGGIGACTGLFLNRLAGIYVLMFGPLLDLFLAQNPLAEESHAIAPYLPGHYPVKLAFDAAVTAHVDLSNLWPAIGYLLIIGFFVGSAFYRMLRLR
ncbi:MAG: hypothetical protein ABEI52_07245 [Halobacteriaceae archaeon]